MVWQSIAPWYDRLEEKEEWIFLSTGLFGYRPLYTLARLMPLLLRYVVGKTGIVMVERGRDMKEFAERKGRGWESGSGRERERCSASRSCSLPLIVPAAFVFVPMVFTSTNASVYRPDGEICFTVPSFDDFSYLECDGTAHWERHVWRGYTQGKER